MVVRKLGDQAIFEVARKIGSCEARQAYLLQVCGEDLAVSQRIEALLHAHYESESFLELPPPGLGNIGTINRPLVQLLGTYIGPYKLLQQIGEGGMGVEHENLANRETASQPSWMCPGHFILAGRQANCGRIGILL